MTYDVVKASALRARGVPNYVIDQRCRPGGPWQRILPGVLLLSALQPTRRQLVQAALAYAGPNAVLTGVDALRARGMRSLPLPAQVHVLQPSSKRLTSYGYVLLERTTRLPAIDVHTGLPLATAERAALDAARRETNPMRVHQLLACIVNQGWCDVDKLRAELEAGSTRGAAAPRSALRMLAHR